MFVEAVRRGAISSDFGRSIGVFEVGGGRGPTRGVRAAISCLRGAGDGLS